MDGGVCGLALGVSSVLYRLLLIGALFRRNARSAACGQDKKFGGT